MIKYRKMKLNDYSQLMKLYKSTKGIVLYSTDKKSCFEVFLKNNQKLCYVALNDDDKVIGAIQGATDYKRGYIHHLVVCRECRNNGIGKRLVLMVVNELKKMKLYDVVVLTDKKNVNAIKFYKKIGFGFLDVKFGYI